MQVLHLFRYPQCDCFEACSRLMLHEGLGIEGDRHAQRGSPRQVLLVSQPLLDRFGLRAGDLFENIVVSEDLTRFHSGEVLQIGQAWLRLTIPCEPCHKLDQVRPGLARQIGQQRGLLGMVIRSGAVTLGDSLTRLTCRLPPIPNQVGDRFVDFVKRIPSGRVVCTSELLLALGVNRAYYRTVPRWIKTAPAALPVHRLVSSKGHLLTAHLPDQVQRLQAEAVNIEADRVSPVYFWHPAHFYEQAFET